MDINYTQLKAAMTAQIRRNEVTANNLANLDNIGFKRDLLFADVFGENPEADPFVRLQTDLSPGHFEETNNALDFAIAGNGFFTIETPRGVAYSRDGHFSLGQDGALINSDGWPVLGQRGRIYLPREHDPKSGLLVTASGELYAAGEYLDTLQVVDFENPDQLAKENGNLFRLEEGEAQLAVDYNIKQGFVEKSNVDPVGEMVELIEIQRQFESLQRIVKTLDQTLKLAAEQVGKYS